MIVAPLLLLAAAMPFPDQGVFASRTPTRSRRLPASFRAEGRRTRLPNLALMLSDERTTPPQAPSTIVTAWPRELATTASPSTSSPRAMTPASGELFFASDRSGNFEVYAMRPDGSSVRRLTTDSASDAWWPRPSPDRTRVLFYRTPTGVHDLDYSRTRLWVMNSDGTGQRELRAVGSDGWDLQGHAEWSPDGESLVMFGGDRSNPQIFITDSSGRSPRQITQRPGTNLDPSFSPDGSAVAFVGCPQATCYPLDYEIYVLSLATLSVERITDDRLRDHDPAFSPDGRTMAWLTQFESAGEKGPGVWDVRLASLHSGDAPRRLFGGRDITSRPVWGTNDSLFVHRLVVGVDPNFQIYRVNIDGTSSRRLTDSRSSNEYPG